MQLKLFSFNASCTKCGFIDVSLKIFLLKVKDIVEKCCHWGANRECVFRPCAACLNVPADDVCTLASCCIRSEILFITDWAKEILKYTFILLLQHTSLFCVLTVKIIVFLVNIYI